jgi:type I restriction enzyme S subunit
VLKSLDDLIENNRRRVAVLEEMAREIYKEWFVRYRFPGHETATFVDSPLGPIPEGWVIPRLNQVATVVRGRSYRSSELVEEGGLLFVNLKCFRRGGGFRSDGLKRYAGVFGDRQVVRQGDIVVAVTDLTQGREIMGRAALVPRLPEERGVISLDVVRVVPNDEADTKWCFACLCWSSFPERVRELASGTTVLHLPVGEMASQLVLWPDDAVRRGFGQALEPIIAQQDTLRSQTDALATIRDLLLPKLVTGQIDVSALDLGDIVDEVTV